MTSYNSFAYDIAVENSDGKTIYYNFINNETELEVTLFDIYDNYKVYSGSVVIPKDVQHSNKTYKVSAIGKLAFYNSLYLTSISIPSSVITIGEDAFKKCTHLESISIPKSVTKIGAGAFDDCTKLTIATISGNITSIDTALFNNCISLSSVTLPSGLKYIGISAFSNCYSLNSITIPNSVIFINERAFEYCSSLTNINIPNGVFGIEEEAFFACPLTSLTIPKSMIYIGKRAFSAIDCSDIVCEVEEPFEIAGRYSPDYVFSPNTYEHSTLYVPKGCVNKYKEAKGWKDFVYIEEGLPSSIQAINEDKNKEGQYYNINGKITATPQKGINIIKMNDGTTKKIIVK